MSHYTGNTEIITYGQDTIDEAASIIEAGGNLHSVDPITISHYEGADDNIAGGWLATEENP